MPMIRRFRSVLALAMLTLPVLAMGGCVAAPMDAPMPPPGSVYYGTQCFAGFYSCVLPAPGQVGAPCSCPGIGAPSYGTIH